MSARSTLVRPAPSHTVMRRSGQPLHVRWLGRVRYQDALAVQHSLFANSTRNHLLLLEHHHVFTLGVGADTANIVGDPQAMGAEVVVADRGGDVTYHGPGQLVGYPILTIPGKRGGGMADTAQYVYQVEQLLIDALAQLGLNGCGRLADFPGVWVDPDSAHPKKLVAIGVRLSRGRSMHGFALNVDPDMAFFDAIVPCGIADKEVTSLSRLGLEVSLKQVADTVAVLADQQWGSTEGGSRADVAWKHRADELSAFSRGEGPGGTGSAEQAVGLPIKERKPEWMRVKLEIGPEYRRLRRVMSDLELVTVCEEAGCPNIFDCWNEGTATFMILGERCTRKCGFCLIDTSRPKPVDHTEPERVAEAVDKMALEYAVVTMVARDDLGDGGAEAVADTIAAIRGRTPDTRVEVLISDLKGDPAALQVVFDARPDVLNHNVETVARLQRIVRPSAGYARSLAVLARAKQAGLATKTSIMLGLGETHDEVVEALTDLSSIGVDIVTLGQYLRPTASHLPIDRWWHPDEFTALKQIGEQLGMAHVEASPLTRSSYHAKQAETAVQRS